MSQGHETRFEKSIDCIHSIPLLCRCFDGVSIHPSIHHQSQPNPAQSNPSQFHLTIPS